MARPRTFDETQALEAAIALFWRRGFEATSIRDLTEEMGIAGPSLYHAFGDKRRLFATALERYVETRVRARLVDLEANQGPRAAIETFLAMLIDRSCTDAERRGCLMINAAIEVAPHDAELGGLIAGYLGEVEAFFTRTVRAGQAAEEIRADLDARDAARLLLATLIGLRVMSRANPDRRLLEGMVRPALKLIEPRSDTWDPASTRDQTGRKPAR